MVLVRSAVAGLVLLLLIGPVAVASAAAGNQAMQLAITSDGFSPAHLTIPAGKRVKVMVHNKTSLPAEVESYDFTVEKVVPGGTHVPVYIGPLKPGKYKLFNDFAPNMTGLVTVRQSPEE